MSVITGFFMAWGMFLAIPCPCKRWGEAARPFMLAELPLIGAIVGGVWAAALWLCRFLPLSVAALLLTTVPWLCTGCIHLDGYMDVCDAVLSRRDLATRQRILKDSHSGAFAVIGMVLLALAQWSFFLTGRAVWHDVLVIPVATRACAGLAVLLLRPMHTSQYSAMAAGRGGFVAALALALAAAIVAPMVLWGSVAPLAAAVVYWLCAACGVKQLDGMNGDISGFALTLGELAGVAVMTCVR
ncbi:MAG: adenosylcobinamide-GDP ribazoletransferase [Oscillospiraceae bacterium]|nr:adenosylcobinamide-GDP ribazoletransferase [Oscillospiraceae bacterium]